MWYGFCFHNFNMQFIWDVSPTFCLGTNVVGSKVYRTAFSGILSIGEQLPPNRVLAYYFKVDLTSTVLDARSLHWKWMTSSHFDALASVNVQWANVSHVSLIIVLCCNKPICAYGLKVMILSHVEQCNHLLSLYAKQKLSHLHEIFVFTLFWCGMTGWWV